MSRSWSERNDTTSRRVARRAGRRSKSGETAAEIRMIRSSVQGGSRSAASRMSPVPPLLATT
jgi:hypothetical protein